VFNPLFPVSSVLFEALSQWSSLMFERLAFQFFWQVLICNPVAITDVEEITEFVNA